MTQLQHVYLTMHGEFTATAWASERFQMGLRIAAVPALSAPAKGVMFDLPGVNHGDVVADYGSTSGTHGTLTRTWTARAGDVGSTENFDAAWQIDLAEDCWTFLNATKALMTSNARWTHVKVAPIADTGAYAGPSAVYTLATPMPGTGATAQPPEVAIACSLRAPIIGRRGRGRMFFPALGTGWDSDGKVGSSTRTTLNSALATLVGNLENTAGWTLIKPIVVVTSAGKSTAIRPTETRVGDRADVQRSRQTAMREAYTSTAL